MLLRSLILSGSAESPSDPAPSSMLDLSNYRLERTFALPTAASRAAAVTYNPDRGTLFVLGGECDGLVELTRTGAIVSTMRLRGFDDTEGVTYIGDGRFVLTEQRLRSAYLVRYCAGGSAARPNLPAVSLAAAADIHRVEAVSHRPPNASLALEERAAGAAYLAGFDFGAATAAVAELFAPNHAEPDEQALSASVVRSHMPDTEIAMEAHDAHLRGKTRAGSVLSAYDFSAGSDPTEGVTIDESGTIHFAEEFPRVHVPSAAPEPASIVWVADTGLLVCRRHAAGQHRSSSRRHESFTKRSPSRPSIR